MNLSRHLYLIFILGLLLPGVLLAYLSIRTVKDEGVLVEKSLEGSNQIFAEALSRHIDRICQTQFDRAQGILKQWSSSRAPDSLTFLAVNLLDVPLVQSLVVIRDGKQVLPPQQLSLPNEAEPVLSAKATDLIRIIRQAYRMGRNEEALRAMHVLWLVPDTVLQSQRGLDLRFGFQLLELKCLVRLHRIEETVAKVKTFIIALLGEEADISPQRRVFYLDEVISTVTTLENLPLDTRDWLFRLHQKLDAFLANAEYVAQKWPDPVREAFSLPSEESGGISVGYQDGNPYWVIGYPWLDQETRIIARLNEQILIETIKTEFMMGNKSLSHEIDFHIVDSRDRILFASDSIVDRDIALVEPLGRQFPRWKLHVFKKGDSEMAALGRRRTALQWLLLLVSCGGLILGSAAVASAVRHERRNVNIKSNFLSAVSHELKTPLTAIRMFSEMLESGRQKEEEKRIRYARLIGEEARRLQGMIEGILSLGRLEEGQSRLNFDTIQPAEVIREVAALMTGTFTKAEITLQVQVDEGIVLNADRDAFRSVVQNLLENALKYSESGSEVFIGLERLPTGIGLIVKDNGIGISKEDQPRIFETFWRAGDELTRRTRGSGLGLAIVKQIADAHKARIEVQSKPGEGTQMTLIFPDNGADHA